ncbi:polysaccharide deacetylase family protein [Rummeliibacillus suwonensis]|uniref:polysaccharide deacetylase family protein n=1 Tax=Rummeliibacillus suwonensis TaxID=1306154 RepID=UPI001FCFCB2A|nr:polysaccharide deacetylase family protein [Rummeliibacillus suwonensis]
MSYVLIGIALVIILFLCYGAVPTVLIRVFEWGIVKRIHTKEMALTFDDGPNPKYTPQLLDLLKKYHIKATFFVVGSNVKKYPEIIKRMADEGHTIGIHSFDHISSWILSPSQLKKQLEMTEKAITECTGEKVSFYRPPWGHFNLFTLWVSKKYTKIMWTSIFGDWKAAKAKNGLLEELQVYAKEGAIFVLHDNGDTLGAEEEAPGYMIRNLEIFLEESKQRNIHFITLKELERDL